MPGCASDLVYTIRLKPGAIPVSQPTYWMAPSQINILQQEIDLLLRLGFIRESASDWAAPAILESKLDGTYRCCIDYRRTNQCIIGEHHPLGNISDLLDRFGNCSWLSKADLHKGYYQVPLSEDCCTKEI